MHTVESAGGRATVRFGEEDVCLVSAVPNGGFTVRTEQSRPDTLRVHFSGDRRESVITATSSPEARATVQEITW
ncbi:MULTISPECIES: hypothetical protein [Streptomyces]|uniref:Uncharacterized protein n=1 Tax=Streptomyces lycii TaxID=2654337 RepID=A0ABQ7FMH7_9ACTN|nr:MULTISPECIES: hypothetical protein [Streptomyces]KAF4409833.1 hypothetical protein GCU69_07000 [Streptomyces lycii]PGH52035.1 hypothetical protein CRI70_03535 [Streptomyces sp. Ru87]